jgi:hypothetical protein
MVLWMHHVSLVSFSSKFFWRVFFGPVGGLMFFGGKDRRVDAPRELLLGFFGGKNTALSVSLEAAMPKGGETAGGEDPDRQEQQIQIGRPKSEGVFKQKSSINPLPPVQISVQRKSDENNLPKIHPSYSLLVLR